jgi:hypothetical protein
MYHFGAEKNKCHSSFTFENRSILFIQKIYGIFLEFSFAACEPSIFVAPGCPSAIPFRGAQSASRRLFRRTQRLSVAPVPAPGLSLGAAPLAPSPAPGFERVSVCGSGPGYPLGSVPDYASGGALGHVPGPVSSSRPVS